MKIILKLLLSTVVVVSVGHGASTPPPSAQALLKDSDRSRGGLEKGVSWKIDITSAENGSKSDRGFEVKARGDDALAQATTPPRNRGEVFLFNDRMMWFFKPGLRKPVGISARQKLSGEAANGDIASTQYARDYDATIVREEKRDGVDTFVLELKAKKKNVTYDRIRYWISKDKHLGVAAEFLSLEGTVLKRAKCTYENALTVAGKTFPFVSELVIEDAKKPANKSVIRYGKPEAKEIPSSAFNVARLIQ